MRLRTTVPALALSVLFAILSGCSGGNSSTTTTTSTQPITVAIGLTSSSIEAGSSLPLTAGVSNDASLSGVTWTLTSGPGSIGNTSTFGATYFAPTTLTAATTASVTATSVKDTTKSYTATFAVTPGVNFAAQTLPVAYIGTPYSANIAASGGTGTLHYTLSSGTLPTGLTLAPTGTLSGTPTAAYSGSFTVQVTDNASPASTATAPIALKIISNISISNAAALPSGTVGQAYNYSLTAANASGTVTWSITSGTLPAGLTLSATTGTISGTPTAPTAGTSVSVTAADASGGSATATLSFKINAALALTSTLPTATPFVALSGAALSATGGIAPYTYAVTSGNLPSGVSLGSDGSVTGTPITSGTYTFHATVQDSAKNSAGADLTFTVGPRKLVILQDSVPSGVVGAYYVATINTTGGTGSVTFSLSVLSGSLPNGISFSTLTGTFTGRAQAAASVTVAVTATDSTSATATRNFTFTFGSTLVPGTGNSTVNGSYAFLLQGFRGDGGSAAPVADMAGSLRFDGVDSISGTIDAVQQQGTQATNGRYLAAIQVTGSYSVNAAGHGVAVLKSTDSSLAYPLVLFFDTANLGADTAGIASTLKLQRGDCDLYLSQVPTAFNPVASGSGTAFRQTLPAAATSAISGNYVYSLSGAQAPQTLLAPSSYPVSAAGRLSADGSGNLSGQEDAATYSASYSLIGTTGSYSAPSTTTGRGTLALSHSAATYSDPPAAYVYYIISPNEFLLMSTTQTATSGSDTIVAGHAYLQRQSAYTNASITGLNAAWGAGGIYPMSGLFGGTGKIYRFNVQTPGQMSVNLQEQISNGAAIIDTSGLTGTRTYGVSSTGRMVVDGSVPINLWFYDTNRAVGFDSGYTDGTGKESPATLEMQGVTATGTPTSIAGSYAMGSPAPAFNAYVYEGSFNFNAFGTVLDRFSAATAVSQNFADSPYIDPYALNSGTISINSFGGVLVTDSRMILFVYGAAVVLDK